MSHHKNVQVEQKPIPARSTTPKWSGDPPGQALGRHGYRDTGEAGCDGQALLKPSSALTDPRLFLGSTHARNGGLSPASPASQGWAPGLEGASRCRVAVGPHPSVHTLRGRKEVHPKRCLLFPGLLLECHTALMLLSYWPHDRLHHPRQLGNALPYPGTLPPDQIMPTER